MITPQETDAATVAQLIQLALGPVFLISGVGVTLNVFTSRLARVVDRARKVEQDLAASSDAAQRAAFERTLAVSARRARLINTAVTLATSSALLTAIVVVMLFSSTLLPIDFSAAIATLFVISMLCLAGAFLVFLVEVRIATAALRIGGRSS